MKKVLCIVVLPLFIAGCGAQGGGCNGGSSGFLLNESNRDCGSSQSSNSTSSVNVANGVATINGVTVTETARSMISWAQSLCQTESPTATLTLRIEGAEDSYSYQCFAILP